MTGFNSKREAAADKLWDKPSVAFDEWWNGDNDERTNPFRLESGAYWAWAGWKAALAQPAQEPVNLLEARRIAAEYGTPDSQVDDGNLYFALSKCLEHIDAQPAQERNFCPRCGKRTNDIHTCLPPQGDA